jgi:hypothetical protein
MEAAFILPMVAGAPDAGASLLTKRMPDGTVCGVDLGEPHMHAANEVHADKTVAQIKAIRDCARFATFEYVPPWGDGSLARDHSMTCMHEEEAGVLRCRKRRRIWQNTGLGRAARCCYSPMYSE